MFSISRYRIKRLIKALKPNSFWQKFILILFEGVLIAGVVGFILLKVESKDNKVFTAKTMAEADFKKVAELTNNRLYATKMLIMHYKKENRKMDSLKRSEYELDKAYYRREYFLAKKEWNKSIGYIPKILKYRFPEKDTLNLVFDSIHKTFRSINNSINTIKRNHNSDSVLFQKLLDKDLVVLSDDTDTKLIDIMYINMINAIRNNDLNY